MRRSSSVIWMAAAVALAPDLARAQVSGTWVAPGDGNWVGGSNWSSAPDFPNAGGTATFNRGPVSVMLPTSMLTLSSIRFDTAAQISLTQGQSPPSHINWVGPALIDVARSKRSAPGATYYTGHSIDAFMSTTSLGTVPNLHYAGPGAVTLRSSSNHYYSQTLLDGGVTLGIINSAAFGSSSGSIIFDGGTLRAQSSTGSITTSAVDVNFPPDIRAGGGTLAGLTAPLRILRPITGAGALTATGPAGVQLNEQNPFTGALRVVGGGTTELLLQNSGSLPAASSYDVSGKLTVSYISFGIANRVSDGTIALNGGSITLTNYNGTEHIGTVSLVGGQNVFSTEGATSGTFVINSSALVRNDRATLLIRGLGLGNSGTFGRICSINFDSPAGIPLIGGGGAAGTPDVSIVPFVACDSNEFFQPSLVTYDANGLRPLRDNTEYVNTLPAAPVSTANVRLNGSILNVTSPKTVNSLLCLNGGGLSTGSTAPLTVPSGVVYGGSIGCPIEFGSAEGIVRGSDISGTVAGTNGVTFNGNVILRNNASTYTGTTTINSGTVTLFGPVNMTGGAPSHLGADSSPIVLMGRGTGAMLTGNGTISRAIQVRADPNLLKGFEPAIRGFLTLSGDIEIHDGPLRLDPLVSVTGTISGNGRLVIGAGAGSLTGAVTLSGDNSFTGGVELGSNSSSGSGSVIIGSDTALGTGTVFVGSGPGTSFNPMTADNSSMSVVSTGNSLLSARTLANPIVMTGALSILGARQLTLTGPIDLNGEARAFLGGSPSPTERTTLAGPVTGGAMRILSSRFTLAGENDVWYTTIERGSTRVAADHALGVAPLYTQVGRPTGPIFGGCTIEFDGGVTIPPNPLVMYANTTGITLRSLSGHNVWQGAVQTVGAFSVGLEVPADSLTVAGGIGGPAPLAMSGVGTIVTRHVRGSAELSIFGGTLRIAPNGTDAATSVVGSLSIPGSPAPAATLDLTNNKLVIDYATDSPLLAVRDLIGSGYANGSWSGTGISSSTAAANPGYALGYAESSALFTNFPATFGGQSVDDTAVLLGYTLYGDANLDGQVNLQDFNRLASNFGASGSGVWSQGDFNYDGNVNLQDFNRLASNFGLSASGPGVTPQDWSALAAAVPEPAAALPGALMLWGLRRRQRRTR